MSGTVLTFPRAARPARPASQPQATRPSGYGGHVYIVDSEDGSFAVYDESASGDSAGHHGWFTDHAEAVEEARAVAKRISAASFADYSKGGAS